MRRPTHPALFSALFLGAILSSPAGLLRAADAAPDWSAAPMQALREEWQAARSTLQEEHKNAVLSLLQQQVQAAQEQLARARVSGNMTQQAVARTSLQVFEEASGTFQKEGNLKLPEQTRREVQPVLEAVRREASGLELGLAARLEGVDREFANRLRELLAGQGHAVADDLGPADLLRRLEGASTDAAPPAPSPGATDSAPPPAAGEDPGEPGVLATNSEEAVDWVPLLSIEIQVATLEIVKIPVMGIASEQSTRMVSMGSQQEIVVRTRPSNVLHSPKGPVVFRLMSVPGRPPAQVMTWPSERNGWELELRCRAQRGGLANAVRLDVARGTEGLRGLASTAVDGGPEEDARADVPRVPVQIVSRPAGAAVLVNGRPAMRDGAPLATPCEVMLPATGAEVVLRKHGFLDSRLGQVVPRPGQPVQAMLAADPNFVERVVRVNAMSPGGGTGIRLNAGQRVRLTVEGTWASGSRGEPVGPEGYPIGRFPHYYVNPALTPRLTTEAPYGALLMRIGATGSWRPVFREMTFSAESTGIVLFEINEAPERNLRRDNTGNLIVRIVTAPESGR